MRRLAARDDDCLASLIFGSVNSCMRLPVRTAPPVTLAPRTTNIASTVRTKTLHGTMVLPQSTYPLEEVALSPHLSYECCIAASVGRGMN